MNTDYQIVAAGSIPPLNTDTSDSTGQSELSRYQETRDERLKKILTSTIVVEIITEFPSYESLNEGAWRHELVGRIYQAVVARTTKRLEHLNPRRFAWPPKSASVNLAWERLHHNDSGKPVYSQRWYIERDHAALLGYPGRLGESALRISSLPLGTQEQAMQKLSTLVRWYDILMFHTLEVPSCLRCLLDFYPTISEIALGVKSVD